MNEHKVQPWTEMPLWLPETFSLEGEPKPWKGGFSIDIESAVKEGLTFRRLERYELQMCMYLDEGYGRMRIKAAYFSARGRKCLLEKVVSINSESAYIIVD